MAYLHCHDCGWGQDDFWNEDYNPIRSLFSWEQDLLEFEKLDAVFDDHFRTWRNVIASEIEKAAACVRKMHFFTAESARDAACPNCGSQNLDID